MSSCGVCGSAIRYSPGGYIEVRVVSDTFGRSARVRVCPDCGHDALAELCRGWRMNIGRRTVFARVAKEEPRLATAVLDEVIAGLLRGRATDHG